LLESELYLLLGYRHCTTIENKNPLAKDLVAFLKTVEALNYKIYLTWRLTNSRLTRQLSIDIY
jgi:hypothetical protein